MLFIDSYTFLLSELASLTKHLSVHQVSSLARTLLAGYSAEVRRSLTTRKQLLPYDLVKCLSSADVARGRPSSLPHRENISQLEYEHYQAVWHDCNWSNLGGLLEDILQIFRLDFLQKINLDILMAVAFCRLTTICISKLLEIFQCEI